MITKRSYIQRVFTDLKGFKSNGVWYSGIEGEGKYKRWYDNGQLFVHCFFKNGLRDGEYKAWYLGGGLKAHRLYKDGDMIKDYLK